MTGVLADYESKVTSITDKMATGSFDDLKAGGYGIVLGVELAKALEV